MRCKNCGTENDDNRYICETCGSPLYDEEDFNKSSAENQQTQTFNAVRKQDALDLGYTPESDDNNGNDDNKTPEKKSIIVIAILVVVLVAIISSVVVVAHTRSKKEEAEKESTTISTTASTTKETTTAPSTTETTTKPTTEPTTKDISWSIKLISKGGGTVDGSGTYKDGDNVTILATPDTGYEFDGWYSNGEKISTTEQYSFTATENVSISAVFYLVTTTEPPSQEPEVIDGGMD